MDLIGPESCPNLAYFILDFMCIKYYIRITMGYSCNERSHSFFCFVFVFVFSQVFLVHHYVVAVFRKYVHKCLVRSMKKMIFMSILY